MHGSIQSGMNVMLNKKWIFVAAIFSLALTASHANVIPTNEHCIMLGPKPSLIVQFNDTKSSLKPQLSPHFIQQLTLPEATFTDAKAMANDAYIVFFSPSKSFQAKQPAPGCYLPHQIDELIKHLKRKADIISASPNVLMNINQLHDTLRVPVVGPKQWNLKDPPGGIDAVNAYTSTTGSANAIVAVLDSGILSNLSLDPNLYSSGVTFNNAGSYSIGAAPSCSSECSGYDHGTHVAGTVAASGAVAYGQMIYGVAPTAKVLPINVFTKFTDSSVCSFPDFPPCIRSYTSDQINALAWLNGSTFPGLPAAPYVISVNMSLGGYNPSCPTSLQNAFNALISKDISFAIAAGNSNSDAVNFSPANCSGIMAIAATGAEGNGSYYTNYGAIVDFAAPGGDVTGAGGILDTIYSTIKNAYDYSQGTSMASPHVAGLTALMYTLDPTLTPTLVNSLIATNTSAFPGTGTYPNCQTIGQPCGTGVINANTTVLATDAQAPSLDWGAPNLVATPTDTTALLEWDAAAWSAPRSTAIAYTAYVNGVAHADCTNVTTISCRVRHLTRGTAYSAYVKASDIRGIYEPAPQSNTVNFTTTNTLTGVTITKATRNPLLTSQAFAYYSSLSNVPAAYYTVDGLPNGATVEIDTENRRFIISTILTPRKVTNVTILANIGVDAVPSNSFTVPNIL